MARVVKVKVLQISNTTHDNITEKEWMKEWLKENEKLK